MVHLEVLCRHFLGNTDENQSKYENKSIHVTPEYGKYEHTGKIQDQ
jgi:hypothetical protein